MVCGCQAILLNEVVMRNMTPSHNSNASNLYTFLSLFYASADYAQHSLKRRHVIIPMSVLQGGQAADSITYVHLWRH